MRFKKFVVNCHLVGQNLLWGFHLAIVSGTAGATATGTAGVAEENKIAEFFVFPKKRKASIYVLKRGKNNLENSRKDTY